MTGIYRKVLIVLSITDAGRRQVEHRVECAIYADRPLIDRWSEEITIGLCFFGAIAQLGERSVRNAKVGGSTPLRSIVFSLEITAFAASGFQQI